MKLDTMQKTARGWKRELRNQVRHRDGGEDMALVAWEIVGGIAALVAIYSIVSMMPEVVRYLKIKRM